MYGLKEKVKKKNQTYGKLTIGSLEAFEKHYRGGRQPFGIYVHPSKIYLKK
jgi:hypothetical protein